MKNLFKYIGVFCLMLFSFYYASYIADFMQSKTNLMEEIKDNTKDKNIKSVDAIIDSDYIIPGLNGISVNTKDSFSNMLKVGVFNEEYLIFDEVKPAISLDDHLDKIIKKGNYLKRSIAIILDNQELLEYSLKNNIKINYLIQKENIVDLDNALLINNDDKYFYQVERFLNNNNRNSNICILNNYNRKICESNGKFLIEPTYVLNNSNMSSLVSEIDSGDIIKINNLSMTNYIILINKIRYRDLKIVYLNDLISEKYSSL